MWDWKIGQRRELSPGDPERQTFFGKLEEPEYPVDPENPDDPEADPGEVTEVGYADSTVGPAGGDPDAAADQEGGDLGGEALDPAQAAGASEQGSGGDDGDGDEEDIAFPWEDLPLAEAVGKMKGAEEFQALCAELMAVAPKLTEKQLTEVLQSRAYLFSIDAGCGISTAVALLTRVIVEEKLAEAARMPIEIVVPGTLTPETGEHIVKLLGQVGNRVVCLDITAWITRGRTPEFLELLLKLYDLRDSLTFVFRVPYMEQSVISEIGDALGDVFSVRTVVFTPLLSEHMAELAEERLGDAGMEADADAKHLFSVRIAEEKSDGRFYGIRTVERIVDEMIYDKIRAGSPGKMVTRDDLAGFVRYDDTDPSVTAAEEMDGLAGMAPVLDQLRTIMVEIQRNRKAAGEGKEELRPMNMRFSGNPGTGKTTVARILGRFFRENGLLSRGYFLEHTGADFLGQYPGSASTQAMQICSDAAGSVLYIDELGALAEEFPEEDGGSAREAADTLASQMAASRGSMAVILAGTESELDALLKADPALEREIPFTVTFPDYTEEQLSEIFLRMVRRDGKTAGNGLDEAVRAYFLELPEKIRGAKDFSNARYVRNLYEKTVSKTIARTRIDHSDRKTILASDFGLACGENMRELNRKQTAHRKIGFQA